MDDSSESLEIVLEIILRCKDMAPYWILKLTVVAVMKKYLEVHQILHKIMAKDDASLQYFGKQGNQQANPIHLTALSASPEPSRTDATKEKEKEVMAALRRILKSHSTSASPISGGPTYESNSCHIDTLLKLSCVLHLHTMKTEKPTSLAKMFALFSRMDLAALSQKQINSVRDEICVTAYNHETGARPGGTFAIATSTQLYFPHVSNLTAPC